ncbi:MAG: hypothetical protein NUV55_11410 [Sulfuricaulis sp.]|uniref:hypothetical protein n=1 Tax=Sulfuricaulis sp. TaxID=2003553 RepID=UPI0025D736BB|nr:hypothetical protein [Sulfuricaulis sp.]MCR4347791.1 hypothetical protein [Sulfuricaulis sp.]
MNAMMKNAFIVAIALASATLVRPVFAEFGVDCHDPKHVKLKIAAKKTYEDMLAHDKAGRTKAAFDAAKNLVPDCASNNKQEIGRMEAAKLAVLRKTSLKLGEQAESKGLFTEAYKYFSEYYHGIAADRVQMKIATAKPGDFETVRTGVNYFRNTQKYLSRSTAEAMDADRDARVNAIPGHLDKLRAIATKNGEKFLADEDKIFNARKTSVAAKGNTLAELNKARDWLGLFGQENRANDRAVKRGDTLLADDSRKSLELAISYYSFPIDDFREKRAQKVKDKARRLGDAHLKKGEKQIAADYYNLAGLGDKASKLEESHEAEKEKAETKRQGQFKKDQKSLEEELGL